MSFLVTFMCRLTWTETLIRSVTIVLQIWWKRKSGMSYIPRSFVTSASSSGVSRVPPIVWLVVLGIQNENFIETDDRDLLMPAKSVVLTSRQDYIPLIIRVRINRVLFFWPCLIRWMSSSFALGFCTKWKFEPLSLYLYALCIRHHNFPLFLPSCKLSFRFPVLENTNSCW